MVGLISESFWVAELNCIAKIIKGSVNMSQKIKDKW